ncbi:hsp70 protein [Fusarium langsethiae]|uniref:Hsp70 protein n=1 Tax=Fusarium langsethiae TaxID=179993 RepID=A0A0M9ESJ4_FUSLA|nr:hsp70 protein [Fusarium langsethiae]GKU06026.1 unnamed protein product [Fusarium langsethiae]
MSFSRSSSMTLGLDSQDDSHNHHDQINGHDAEPELIDLARLLEDNDENPFPKRLIIAIDFGTTYSAVSYVAIPEGCPSELVDITSIQSIRNFPENQTFFPRDEMDAEVPTEVIYPLNRHFRDQDPLLSQGQDSNGGVGDESFSSTCGIDLGNGGPRDADGDIFMPAQDSDQFLWGYQVHQAWSLPATHYNTRNEPLARFKLLLDNTPQTANIRAKLNITLNTLKRKRVVQKPLHVIADFLTQLLQHTQRQLQYEGLDNSYQREIVLCVPAIWTQKACRDMQSCLTEAMRRANFPGVDLQNNSIENLFIVSEPEAAAAHIIRTSGQVKSGDTFVLLDAGGGTVDANTYLVSDDEPLTLIEERVEPGGGLHGSSYLNEEFCAYLNARLADEAYLEQGTDTINGIVERFIFDQFEYRIKRSYDCYNARQVSLYQIPNLRADEEKGFINGSIKVTAVDINKIFYKHLSAIGDIMEQQIVQALNISCRVEKVILTGGFGASVSLRQYLRRRLADICQKNNCRITLITPSQEAGILNAVASGAVFRALNKDVGPERMARASYGIQRTEPFKQYPEHQGLKPSYDRHDGQAYITKTIDWVLKLGQRVPSVWECEPFTCSHTFNSTEKKLICRELLYVSDHSKDSHFKISHPKNQGAECVGEIIIDCTFLLEEGRITVINPIILPNGEQIGRRHYRVNFTMAIRVVDRHLECFAIHEQKIIKRCRINIASGFRPGGN